MSYVFKPGEYKTRDGRRAVVLSDEYHNGGYTLTGVTQQGNGGWVVCTWANNGRYCVCGGNTICKDLIPPEEKRWMNVYPDRGSIVHEDEQRAIDGKCTDALGTIELTFSADKLVEVKIV